jgi:hypothetical protein
MNKWCSCLFLVFLCTSAQLRADQDFIVDLKLAGTETSSGAFKSEDISFDQSLGWAGDAWIGRLGYTDFGEMAYLGQSYGGLYLSVKGPYLEVARKIDLFWRLQLELGGGVYRNSINTEYYGHDLGSTTGTDPFIDLALTKELISLLSLQVGVKYVKDVGGTNLTLLSGGVRFSFW